MTEEQTLNECLEAFKKETSAKKLKKAIECNLNLLHLAKENYRGRKEQFYTSMSYELRLVNMYLIALCELELYSFNEDELNIFAF